MGRLNLWAKLKLSKEIPPTNSQKLQFLREDMQSSCVELKQKNKKKALQKLSAEKLQKTRTN